MPRTSVEVNKDLFIAAITKAEQAGPLANRNTLAEKVAEIYNNLKPPKLITFSIVLSRIKEWSIAVKTPVGKRGRQGGNPEGLRKAREARAAAGIVLKRDRSKKLKKNPRYEHAVQAMRQVCISHKQEKYLPLVDQVAQGKNPRKLNCLFCTGFQIKEIKLCTDLMCPFWLTRPYQNVETEEDVAADDAKTLEEMQAQDE